MKQNTAKVWMQLLHTDLTPASEALKHPGCTGEMLCPRSTCRWTAERDPALHGFLAPAHDAEGRGKEQAHWGSKEHAAPLSALLDHAMSWGETGEIFAALEQGQREGTMFLSGKAAVMWGRKRGCGRVYVLGSGAKRWGKPRSKLWSHFCTAETPSASTSLAFSQARGWETHSHGNKTLGQAHFTHRTLHYTQPKCSSADLAQTPVRSGKPLIDPTGWVSHHSAPTSSALREVWGLLPPVPGVRVWQRGEISDFR